MFNISITFSNAMTLAAPPGVAVPRTRRKPGRTRIDIAITLTDAVQCSCKTDPQFPFNHENHEEIHEKVKVDEPVPGAELPGKVGAAEPEKEP